MEDMMRGARVVYFGDIERGIDAHMHRCENIDLPECKIYRRR